MRGPRAEYIDIVAAAAKLHSEAARGELAARPRMLAMKSLADGATLVSRRGEASAREKEGNGRQGGIGGISPRCVRA